MARLYWRHHCFVTALVGPGLPINIEDVKEGKPMLVFGSPETIGNFDPEGTAFAGTLDDFRRIKASGVAMEETRGYDIIVPFNCWQPNAIAYDLRVLRESRAHSAVALNLVSALPMCRSTQLEG